MSNQQIKKEAEAIRASFRRLGFTALADAIEDNRPIKSNAEYKKECDEISQFIVKSHLVSEI